MYGEVSLGIGTCVSLGIAQKVGFRHFPGSQEGRGSQWRGEGFTVERGGVHSGEGQWRGEGSPLYQYQCCTPRIPET